MNLQILFVLLISLLRINALPLFSGFASEVPLTPVQETEETGQKQKKPENALMKFFKRADLNTIMNYANLASTGLMLVSTAASLSDYFKSKKQQSDAAKSASAAEVAATAVAPKPQVITETASPVYVTATIDPASATTMATVVYVTELSTSSRATAQQTEYVTVSS